MQVKKVLSVLPNPKTLAVAGGLGLATLLPVTLKAQPNQDTFDTQKTLVVENQKTNNMMNSREWRSLIKNMNTVEDYTLIEAITGLNQEEFNTVKTIGADLLNKLYTEDGKYHFIGSINRHIA